MDDDYNALRGALATMTPGQETAFQSLNDVWGVAEYEVTDGTVYATLDDGDKFTISPDGLIEEA